MLPCISSTYKCPNRPVSQREKANATHDIARADALSFLVPRGSAYQTAEKSIQGSTRIDNKQSRKLPMLTNEKRLPGVRRLPPRPLRRSSPNQRNQNHSSPIDPKLILAVSNTEVKNVLGDGAGNISCSMGVVDSNISSNQHHQRQSNSFVWKGYESGPWLTKRTIPVEKVAAIETEKAIEAQYKFKATSNVVVLPVSCEEARVPLRRIVPLKRVPKDPLAKLRREQREFSLGFKLSKRGQSIRTANDPVMTHELALLQLCEAYTSNLGRDYLFSMSRECIDSPEGSEEEQWTWTPGSTLVENPNERIWNWNQSLLTSRNLRTNKVDDVAKELATAAYLQSEQCIGSLGLDELDAKSNLSALFMIHSDGSTDCDFDEHEFIRGTSEHPFTDPLVLAGYSHRNKARSKWLHRQPRRLRNDEATESQVSELHSVFLEPDEESGLQEETSFKEALSEHPMVYLINTQDDSPDYDSITEAKGRKSVSLVENLPKKRTKSVRRKSSKQSKSLHPKVLYNDKTDTLEENASKPFMSGFENYTVDWEKILSASGVPNPMRWMETLAMAHPGDAASLTSEDGSDFAAFDGYGLRKRFVSVAGGIRELYNLIQATSENDQPKAELLLDCMVKHFKLKMPLAIGDPVRLQELYNATIVKSPLLYKLVLRRRNILPPDLQFFVGEILSVTEASDAMLSALLPSPGLVTMIVNAAKEMFSSGLLDCGPKCPFEIPNSKNKNAVNLSASVDSSFDPDTPVIPSANELPFPMGKEETHFTRVSGLSNDADRELAFRTSLRNPSNDILEEVASYLPEFSYHIRPLFETKWVSITTDSLSEEILPELKRLRQISTHRLDVMRSSDRLTTLAEIEEGEQIHRLCKSLVLRICRLVRGPAGETPGSGVWMGLLACIHDIMFWPPIGDFLICKLHYWIPPLLLSLQSQYTSIREDGCCVLSFLVSCYPVFSRLHFYSRYLLASNIAFAVFDAIDRFPESYAFFHSVLGYMLHSVPCTAVVDCLLIWAPDVLRKPNSLCAKEWPRFIYYLAKYWPDCCMRWNIIYKRKILRLLETGMMYPASKSNARLALSYFARRTSQVTPWLTYWPSHNK